MTKRKGKAGSDASAQLLGSLSQVLQSTTLAPRIEGDTLVATHEHYRVRVEVAAPRVRDTDVGPIRAVVRVLCELPKVLAPTLGAGRVMLNSMASLGALTERSGATVIGSRVTLYEAEDSWGARELPLVAFATIAGAEPILGALRRSMGVGEAGGRRMRSEWKAQEFDALAREFGALGILCSAGGLGFTAEFELEDGPPARASRLASPTSALFQLDAESPHPELGAGVLCLLQMPHQTEDEGALHAACEELNRRELEGEDLPPHFGAWCPGRLDGAPAYVSFLPNALHRIPRLAHSVVMWAAGRAAWADGVLDALGVRRRPGRRG